MAWSTPVSGLALVVLGTAVFYPDASAIIVPTRETLTLLGDDLRDAWQVFSDDAAPVPPVRGFVVTTAVLLWYGVFLADWAAFRLRSPLSKPWLRPPRCSSSAHSSAPSATKSPTD